MMVLWKNAVLLGHVALLGTAFGAASIPPRTGRHTVGMKRIEIPYVNTDDAIAPNNVTTAFLATVYYPTPPCFAGAPVPYLDRDLATLFENAYGVTAGSFANLTTEYIIQDAPFLDGTGMPTVLFGPAGNGPPVAMFSILLADLASHGYTVIGADHPYEQPFIRWPNGTVLYGLPPFSAVEWVTPSQLFTTRVKEQKAVVDNLPLIERKLGGRVNSTHIGAFGHSTGGSSAVGAMLRDSRISSAMNVDGTFWTEDEDTDAIRPVLLLSEPTEDPTWVSFGPKQTGWWKHLQVNGSEHSDFIDATFWKEVTDVKAHSSSLGDINGYRMVNITRTLVRDFFEFTLRGLSIPILNGTSPAWPEVMNVPTENGTTTD